jgi:RsiW-degrading membrane proteinase PrsW (M82 family)
MIIAIIFAHVWGVIQLIVLASFARTIRVRTVLAALAVGLYACAPGAALLQIAWARSIAWMTGESLHHMAGVATYTIDPFIEEIVKVLPVLVLLMVQSIRRQWSITDCVLTGAAVGSGFGLAENLYRFGASPYQALTVHGGWSLATSLALPFVPSIRTTLTSWLPPGTSAGDIFFPGISGQPWVNLHLAWSAIGGLAVGLMRLRPGVVGRIAGALLLLYIGLDHAAWNATGAYGSSVRELLVAPFASQRGLLVFLPIAAFAVAWWLDRRRQNPTRSDQPVLKAEVAAPSPFIGTLRAAVSRLPWSLPRAYGFVRLRRAYNSALASGASGESDDLRTVVFDARDRIDQDLVQLESPRWFRIKRMTSAWLRALTRPRAIIGLVLVMPSVVWFVVGGWPQTAWLQTMMMGPVAWKVVLALSILSLAWIAWQIVVGTRSLPKVLRFPIGEDAAVLGLRIASGAGTVALGAYALLSAFPRFLPTQHLFSNADAREAMLEAALGSLLMMTGSVAFGLPLWSDGWGKQAVADSPVYQANLADQKAAEAKASLDKAEAGVKAASDSYAAYKAQADQAAAALDQATDAWNKAQANAEAAQATGNKAAIAVANGQAAAADAALSRATAANNAAESARRGALVASQGAVDKAQAARDAHQSAVEVEAYAETKAAAARAQPGDPHKP